MQLEYANRNPSLIRACSSRAFSPRAGRSTPRQMMLDQGYGDGDLVLRLNQLKWYLRTVVQRDPRLQDALRRASPTRTP